METPIGQSVMNGMQVGAGLLMILVPAGLTALSAGLATPIAAPLIAVGSAMVMEGTIDQIELMANKDLVEESNPGRLTTGTIGAIAGKVFGEEEIGRAVGESFYDALEVVCDGYTAYLIAGGGKKKPGSSTASSTDEIITSTGDDAIASGADDIASAGDDVVTSVSTTVETVTEGASNLVDGLDVIDGRILGKIPVDEFTSIRTRSIHTPDGADTLMLGKFEGTTLPDGTIDWTKAGPNSYIEQAKATNSSYFDLGSEWDEIVNNYDLSRQEMFDMFNAPALDDAVNSNMKIKFSHDPTLPEYAGQFIDDEWKYLQSKYGYKTLKLEGGFWIASK